MGDKLRHFKTAVFCGLDFNDALNDGVKEQNIEPDGYSESYINISDEDYERLAIDYALSTESKDKSRDLKMINTFSYEGDELLTGLEINMYGVDLGKKPLIIFHDSAEMQKIIETDTETRHK